MATVTEPKETPQEALSRIQSMRFCGNDVLVIEAFCAAGIPADEIDPRHNVLTFKAWKAKGRRVAKGAKSIGVTVWIPFSGKKSEQPADGDDKKKRSGLRPKLTRLFHEYQTVEADAEKGTRPKAWNNPALVREGTYEPEQWTESTTIEQVESEMREELTGKPATQQEFSGPTIGDIQPSLSIMREETLELDEDGELQTVEEKVCNCPMAGFVINAACPIHANMTEEEHAAVRESSK